MSNDVSSEVINLAIKLADKSTMRYKMSAVIFNKKGRIINTGYNRWLLIGHHDVVPHRTSIHAEADAIIGCSLRDLYNSSIFVFRRNFRNAKPCHNCTKMIRNAGITQIYYSNDGIIKKFNN